MSFASSSRDLSASRWAGVADSSIVHTSQSVHSRRTAILPRVGSRRISVSIRPTRRVLRMGKRCPFRGWKGCRTSAHPKDSLDAWVVRSNRGHTEDSNSSITLRYRYLFDRRWKIAPRGQTVPQCVEIVCQVLLELSKALRINTRRTPVRLHAFPGLVHHAFRYRKRLRRCHRFLPSHRRLIDFIS